MQTKDIHIGRWYAAKTDPKVIRRVIPCDEPGYVMFHEYQQDSPREKQYPWTGQSTLRGIANWASHEVEAPGWTRD